MILPDVNLLVYAFRQDAPNHAVSFAWLKAVVDGEAAFGISPLALAAVARIATNPRAYREPSSIEEALRFGDFLLEQPHCHVVEPGERHWGIFRHLLIEAGIRGPRVTDAWYAALAIEWGCEWVSFDRDYARFPGLNWSTPTSPAGGSS